MFADAHTHTATDTTVGAGVATVLAAAVRRATHDVFRIVRYNFDQMVRTGGYTGSAGDALGLVHDGEVVDDTYGVIITTRPSTTCTR